ncbi:hypothetical protein V6N13_036387 [Hibiscus sabdariffa]
MWQKTSVAGKDTEVTFLERPLLLMNQRQLQTSVGWGSAVDGSNKSASHAPLVESDKETDEDNYITWRLEKGVAEGSTEILKATFLFSCQWWQELIARTHHRGVIRNRSLPLKFLNNNGKEVEGKGIPSSEMIDTVSNKKLGSVTTALGFRGIGVLQLDNACKDTLAIQGQEDIKVMAIRPDWWAAKWFQDQQHTATA